MSEDLTDYLLESGVKARYLHSEIDTLERIQIIRELRLGEYDVLVGVNLLREGLDLPEVSLVAILDADKEGFLRGQTALIQTIGRAARNVNGKVLMYADKLTEAIKGALEETGPPPRDPARATTREHGITPESIVKGVSDIAEFLALESPTVPGKRRRGGPKVEGMSRDEIEKLAVTLEEEMLVAAEELRFEYAAKLRDEIKELRRELQATAGRPSSAAQSITKPTDTLLMRSVVESRNTVTRAPARRRPCQQTRPSQCRPPTRSRSSAFVDPTPIPLAVRSRLRQVLIAVAFWFPWNVTSSRK